MYYDRSIFLFSMGSSIGYELRLMKRKSLVQTLLPLPLYGDVKKKKKNFIYLLVFIIIDHHPSITLIKFVPFNFLTAYI
jgi:hypothetical protein